MNQEVNLKVCEGCEATLLESSYMPLCSDCYSKFTELFQVLESSSVYDD